MDAAYTASEIAESLAQEDIALSEPALERALAQLVNRQRVEMSTREGRVYYSYRRWLGLRRR
jgi:predicted transcriptional regulator